MHAARLATKSQPTASARLFGTSTHCSQRLTTREPASRRLKPWSRPIRSGINQAYDQALVLIRNDADAKNKELEKIQTKLNSLEPSTSEYQDLRRKVQKLEISSKINLPEVRWNFKQGKEVDLSQPVYRHLVEKHWRQEGRLDQLMERVYQMHVVPDVIPTINPTIDLHVIVDPLKKTSIPRDPSVEPGIFLPTAETIQQPRVQATVFHPETRLYTLLVIDPDVPSPETMSFTSYLHWLHPNIPLSATTSSEDVVLSDSIIPYVPPHPQKGTPYHRYVTLLLPQESHIDLGSVSYQRLGFSARDFISQHVASISEGTQMDKQSGIQGGIHMWRSKWDEDVSGIYQNILEQPEPQYGPPPKVDPYAGRRDSRYI